MPSNLQGRKAVGSVAVAMCSSEVNQSFQRVQLIALTVLFQEEQKLVAMLEREMVQQNPGVSWNDIAGMTTSKSLPKTLWPSKTDQSNKARIERYYEKWLLW